jgi:hypothetical protein
MEAAVPRARVRGMERYKWCILDVVADVKKDDVDGHSTVIGECENMVYKTIVPLIPSG